jgi:hypothetical protein
MRSARPRLVPVRRLVFTLVAVFLWWAVIPNVWFTLVPPMHGPLMICWDCTFYGGVDMTKLIGFNVAFFVCGCLSALAIVLWPAKRQAQGS